MKWSKPQFENRRFGFEVTMYVYIASKQTLTTASSKITNATFQGVHHEKV